MRLVPGATWAVNVPSGPAGRAATSASAASPSRISTSAPDAGAPPGSSARPVSVAERPKDTVRRARPRSDTSTAAADGPHDGGGGGPCSTVRT